MKYFSEKDRFHKEGSLSKYPKIIRDLFYSIRTVHDYYDDALAPLVGPQTMLLDAGCGKKGIMELYEKKNLLTVGIDLSLSAMKENRSMDVFAVSNLKDIPFRNGVFDIIISAWVLEHLSDPMAAFREFYRILKDRGNLILVTNSIYNPMMFLSLILPQDLRDSIKKRIFPPEFDEDTFPTYYRCNSIRKMDNDLKKVGFSKLIVNYCGDPSIFLTFKPLFPLVLLYERITDLRLFNMFKMHIVGHYVKPK
jgi:SAM-dependent methyltransferase